MNIYQQGIVYFLSDTEYELYLEGYSRGCPQHHISNYGSVICEVDIDHSNLTQQEAHQILTERLNNRFIK